LRNASSDEEAQAKRFLARSDKATVFVYRTDSGKASTGPLSIFLSFGGPLIKTGAAREVTSLPPGTFIRMELDAGQHELVSMHLSSQGLGFAFRSLPINVQHGHLYFFSVDAGHGLKRSEEEAAKEVVCLCQMVKESSNEGHGNVLYTRVPNPRKPYQKFTFDKESLPTLYLQRER
jgi:hypothetical protein